MCGIAGIIGRLDEPNRAALQRMSDAMVHRGPDDSGTWISAPDARRHRLRCHAVERAAEVFGASSRQGEMSR